MMKVFNRGYLVGLVLLGVLAGPHLLAKPLPLWPLEISYESKSPKNVDVPVVYEMVFREGSNGPVRSFTVTLKTDRDLKYSGQTQWRVDFQGKDEFRIPIEIMIGKNDTGGIVLEVQAVYESGDTAWMPQPSQFYFLPDTGDSFRTQVSQPPQVTPRAWVEIFGSQWQKDSMGYAEHNRLVKEAEEQISRQSPPDTPKVGTVSTGTTSSKYMKTFQDKLIKVLRRVDDKESTPLMGKEIEYAEFGKVYFARLEGESAWRLWKPYSISELDSLDLNRITSEPRDRFIEKQVLYLSLSDDSTLAKARSLIPQLRQTDINGVYEAEVTIEEFRLIIQNKLRFEKNISDIAVPGSQDTTQGSIDFDDHRLERSSSPLVR